MKIVSRESIEELKKIGEGKCASIYKNGNSVYKVLKEKSDSRSLYSKEMLQQLAGIKSDLCVFPNEILEDNNGDLLGYLMDFVSGKKMKDAIGTLSFEQIQAAIEKAKQSIRAMSEQGILFDDMHDDNVMWDEETQSIKIIDTDFFKKVDNIPNLNDINYQIFSKTIQHMIDTRIYQYGTTVDEALVPFYDRSRLSTAKDGKPLPINEYLLNLRSIMENDFGSQFNNLDEMEMALQQKQSEAEEEQHLEAVANNLTIKEKFIRFLAQSKYIRRIPFVDKFINNRIKMLPTDVQEVVNRSTNNTDLAEPEQVEKESSTEQARKKFCENLRNWTSTQQENPTSTTEKTEEKTEDKAEDKTEDNTKDGDESDDLTL